MGLKPHLVRDSEYTVSTISKTRNEAKLVLLKLETYTERDRLLSTVGATYRSTRPVDAENYLTKSGLAEKHQLLVYEGAAYDGA